MICCKFRHFCDFLPQVSTGTMLTHITLIPLGVEFSPRGKQGLVEIAIFDQISRFSINFHHF